MGPPRRAIVAAAFAALVALFSSQADAAPYAVRSGFGEATVGRGALVTVDPTGVATIESVRALPESAWKESLVDAPNEGYRPGAIWAHVVIEDTREVPEPLVLEVPYAPADEVSVVRVDGDAIAEARAGDHVPHAAWPRATLMPSFLLPAARAHDLYVRVKDASLQVPMVLRTEANSERAERFRELTAVAYYAVVLALALYNFLLFVGTRVRIYGVYVTYVLSFALFFATMNGVGSAVLWRDSALMSDRSPLVFLCVAMIAITQVVRALLGLGEGAGLHHRLAPRVGPVLAAMSVVTVLMPWPWALGALTVVGLTALAFALSSAAVEAARGARAAKLFLLAFGLLIAFCFTFALANAGVLPLGSSTATLLPIGSALEQVTLAFALADRIKALQQEATRQAELARTFAEESKRNAERALDEQARTNRELERLAKLKDAFLANTSHELRTPLNGILGLAELTLAGTVGPVGSGVARNLGIIRTSARRLGSLVNDILDFAKVREGKLAIRTEAVSLREEVAAVVAILEPLAEDKGLRLVSEVDEALWVRADGARLQQILTNLLGNAIKFTREGSVAVRAAREGDRVVVSIADTGVGIAAKDRERIFESFEQGDGSAARDQGGTGLGLAVTKELVELHGGRVSVTSEVGKGSVFSFDLEASAPAEEGARVSHVTREDAAPASGSPREVHAVTRLTALEGHTLTVLVVDDEPVNREVLAQHLTARGFVPELLPGGREAVARLRDATRPLPDLVLLDVMMPEVTGYDVLADVRPSLSADTLPILLLTAKAQESDLARGFSLGASDYLLKPLSFVELDARLAHHAKLVLATREGRRELEARRRLQGELETTESKLADAQGLATLGTLVAGIAHDLRNPLQFVMAATEQLREATAAVATNDAEVREAAREQIERATEWVETGAQKMDALSRAMRNQARTDHDRTVLVLAEAVDEAWLLCRGRAAEAVVTFDVSDASVYVDPVGFGQLVMNLLSNAADALHEHGVRAGRPSAEGKRIHVVGRVDGDDLELAVHDNGPGVPEALRARVLEAFFTTKPRGLGTGLGLAIVGRVAQEHGGTVCIDESPELGGARFTVRWSNVPVSQRLS
jgi:signal transduction histidine kinase